MQIPGHLHKIPNYVATVNEEVNARNAAILNLNTSICGVEIRQMTLRDWVILDGLDSPLLDGGTPSLIQLMDFLWLMSPRFKKRSYIRRGLFRLGCLRIKYGRAVAAIRKYMDITFQDFPPSPSDPKSQWEPPELAFTLNLVHLLAEKYHWSEESIETIPLRKTFQYLKRIRMGTEGPAAAGWSRSEIIKTKWNRKCREERELKRNRERLIELLKQRN